MNYRIGTSTGWRNSCGTISGRASPTLRILVRGQNIIIWVMGLKFRRMPCRLVSLIQK